VLLNPTQLAGKVNEVVARLNLDLFIAVEGRAQLTAFVRGQAPYFIDDSLYVRRCHSLDSPF